MGPKDLGEAFYRARRAAVARVAWENSVALVNVRARHRDAGASATWPGNRCPAPPLVAAWLRTHDFLDAQRSAWWARAPAAACRSPARRALPVPHSHRPGGAEADHAAGRGGVRREPPQPTPPPDGHATSAPVPAYAIESGRAPRPTLSLVPPVATSGAAARRNVVPPRPGQPPASAADAAASAHARSSRRRADARAHDQNVFGGLRPAGNISEPSVFEVPTDRLGLLNLMLDSGAAPPGLARESTRLARWAPQLRPLARSLLDEVWRAQHSREE